MFLLSVSGWLLFVVGTNIQNSPETEKHVLEEDRSSDLPVDSIFSLDDDHLIRFYVERLCVCFCISKRGEHCDRLCGNRLRASKNLLANERDKDRRSFEPYVFHGEFIEYGHGCSQIVVGWCCKDKQFQRKKKADLASFVFLYTFLTSRLCPLGPEVY